MATATQQKEGIFLPGLARAFEAVDTSGDISTLEFAKAVEAILPVFDRLGEGSATCKRVRAASIAISTLA